MRTLFVLALALLPQQEEPAPIPGWHSDLPSGFAEAKKTGKPLLVVFR
jgi:hypothetical protein